MIPSRPETPEPHDHRIKRLRMRSWRRGTKEMDLVLGPYADAMLAQMPADELDLYEALLTENDQDLYQWVSGQAPAPAAFADLVARLASFASRRGGHGGN